MIALQHEFEMYNRLFTKILDSSIWLEPANTRIVWITLLAAMDETGYAHFSAIENLASRARVSIEETQKALECLMAPDPNSANPANEGKRVERVPGGFVILNAEDHRRTLNREIQREKTRLRVAKHRALQKGNKNDVTTALPNVTSASASASFLEELKRDPLNTGVDIDRELEKAKQWCSRKGRRCTERFFRGWVERADRVVSEPKKEPIKPLPLTEQDKEWHRRWEEQHGLKKTK